MDEARSLRKEPKKAVKIYQEALADIKKSEEIVENNPNFFNEKNYKNKKNMGSIPIFIKAINATKQNIEKRLKTTRLQEFIK